MCLNKPCLQTVIPCTVLTHCGNADEMFSFFKHELMRCTLKLHNHSDCSTLQSPAALEICSSLSENIQKMRAGWGDSFRLVSAYVFAPMPLIYALSHIIF